VTNEDEMSDLGATSTAVTSFHYAEGWVGQRTALNTVVKGISALLGNNPLFPGHYTESNAHPSGRAV
jgi:hypothetical protein